MTTETIWGLVLAGGKSRRMGRDKALLMRDGKSALQRAVNLLAQYVDRVFVSTREEQATDTERALFEQIVDRYDDVGPVAGILSAMEFNPNVCWLVMACDLPNVDATTIEFLIDNQSGDHPATAFRSSHDDLPEPLCAIYRPAARLAVADFVANGVICPRKILINSDTHLLTQPHPAALHNVNAPEDLVGTGVEIAT